MRALAPATERGVTGGEEGRTTHISKKATVSEFKPFESMRYKIYSDDIFIGYVSRFYYDGRDHWFMWNDQGVKSETKSLREALARWAPYRPGIGFKRFA